jgi:hypothetical protein
MKLLRYALLLCACHSTILPHVAAAEEAPPAQYLVEFMIFTVSPELVAAIPAGTHSYRVAGPLLERGTIISQEDMEQKLKSGEATEFWANGPLGWVGEGASVTVYNQELTFVDSKLLWNGQELPADPGIKLLSAPVLTLIAGKEARVEVVTQTPVASFIPAGPEHPDLYRYQVTQVNAGFKLDVSFTEEQRPEEIGMKLRHTLDELSSKRDELKGVALDVGPPLTDSSSIESTLFIPRGHWACFLLPHFGEEKILVFMRPTRQ